MIIYTKMMGIVKEGKKGLAGDKSGLSSDSSDSGTCALVYHVSMT